MRTFTSLDEFSAAVGEHLGYSDWHEITQAQISAFADATGDHQWIHVDPQRAAAGPFGKTIAHGYLTLSMLPVLTGEIYRIENLAMGINYGLDRLRFPSPVPVDSRIRAGAQLREIKDSARGKLAYSTVTVELDGHERPACVAETVTLFVAG